MKGNLAFFVWANVGKQSVAMDPRNPGDERLLQASLAGAFSVPGDEGMSKGGCAVADISAGMYALTSVLAALGRRDCTGRRYHAIAPHGTFARSDGSMSSIGRATTFARCRLSMGRLNPSLHHLIAAGGYPHHDQSASATGSDAHTKPTPRPAVSSPRKATRPPAPPD